MDTLLHIFPQKVPSIHVTSIVTRYSSALSTEDGATGHWVSMARDTNALVFMLLKVGTNEGSYPSAFSSHCGDRRSFLF